MANTERFETAVRDFRAVAEKAGLPEPDEVNYREDEEEIEFIWHERKICVVVELDGSCEAPLPDAPF